MNSIAAKRVKAVNRGTARARKCAGGAGTAGNSGCTDPASHYRQAVNTIRNTAHSQCRWNLKRSASPRLDQSDAEIFQFADGSMAALAGRTGEPPACWTIRRMDEGNEAKTHLQDEGSERNGPSQLARCPVLGTGYAANTRRAYLASWGGFTQWRGQDLERSEPATHEEIAQYARKLQTEGKTPATVRVRLAGISTVHQDTWPEIPDPNRHRKVKNEIREIARDDDREQKQATPLNADDMARVLETAHRPRNAGRGVEGEVQAAKRGAKDIALIAVMRDGLLRAAEAAALTWKDLTPLRDGTARLHINRSKTDQEGTGATVYLSREATTHLLDMRNGSSPKPETPMFGISANWIGKRITQVAKHAGLEGHYSGHSPRVGMAQDLSEGGAEMPALMTAGRWTSEAMPARYTKNVQAGRGAVARYYAGSSGIRNSHERVLQSREETSTEEDQGKAMKQDSPESRTDGGSRTETSAPQDGATAKAIPPTPEHGARKQKNERNRAGSAKAPASR